MPIVNIFILLCCVFHCCLCVVVFLISVLNSSTLERLYLNFVLLGNDSKEHLSLIAPQLCYLAKHQK